MNPNTINHSQSGNVFMLGAFRPFLISLILPGIRPNGTFMPLPSAPRSLTVSRRWGKLRDRLLQLLWPIPHNILLPDASNSYGCILCCCPRL